MLESKLSVTFVLNYQCMKINFVYLQKDLVSYSAHHTQDGLNKLLNKNYPLME